MKLTLVKEGGLRHEGFRIKSESLQVAEWYEEYLIETRGKIGAENTLNREIDGLKDMDGDIVADESGKLYIATSNLRSAEHFGEYKMWAEIEREEYGKD